MVPNVIPSRGSRSWELVHRNGAVLARLFVSANAEEAPPFWVAEWERIDGWSDGVERYYTNSEGVQLAHRRHARRVMSVIDESVAQWAAMDDPPSLPMLVPDDRLSCRARRRLRAVWLSDRAARRTAALIDARGTIGADADEEVVETLTLQSLTVYGGRAVLDDA